MKAPLLDSLRSRVLLIVLLVGVAPIASTGWWLTGEAARSGEILLRSRLQESLARATTEIGGQWVRQRGLLLAIAENPTIRGRLAASSPPDAAPDPLATRLERRGIQELVIRDVAGNVVHAESSGGEATNALDPPLTVSLVLRRPDGTLSGEIQSRLARSAVIPTDVSVGGASAVTFTVADRATGAILLPVPFDPGLLQQASFTWSGQRWLVERRRLVEPEIDLFAAAPLDPFLEPVDLAAARSTWIFLIVTLAALVLSGGLTLRATRPLADLSSAAEAVARGDLSRRVQPAGPAEIRSVTTAFNSMIESLERTLDALSHREALAAVGEFASELAHEVRTPLTSMRIDLQVLTERIPRDPHLEEIGGDLIATLDRLERTVSGALEVARSGRTDLQPITLSEPLEEAVREALPLFAARGAALSPARPEFAHVPVLGDRDSLQRLFLNLLTNAAEALPHGGEATIDVEPVDAEGVLVTIRDNGPGIPPETLHRAFQPFFTTKTRGTGLGLAIARRIADAHGGVLRIESVPAGGTVVSLRLQRLEAPGNEA
jgi:signal transduction histidine kinase